MARETLAEEAILGRTCFSFIIEIDGVEVGRFAEISGLAVEQEVIEYREGSEPGVTRKLPGAKKYSNILLKRGIITSSGDFFHAWLLANLAGGGAPVLKSGVIIAVKQSGTEVARWNFTNGWPAKYEVGVLKAKGNDVAIESLTLVVEAVDLP